MCPVFLQLLGPFLLAPGFFSCPQPTRRGSGGKDFSVKAVSPTLPGDSGDAAPRWARSIDLSAAYISVGSWSCGKIPESSAWSGGGANYYWSRIDAARNGCHSERPSQNLSHSNRRKEFSLSIAFGF